MSRCSRRRKIPAHLLVPCVDPILKTGWRWPSNRITPLRDIAIIVIIIIVLVVICLTCSCFYSYYIRMFRPSFSYHCVSSLFAFSHVFCLSLQSKAVSWQAQICLQKLACLSNLHMPVSIMPQQCRQTKHHAIRTHILLRCDGEIRASLHPILDKPRWSLVRLVEPSKQMV